jgi:hypothetical protein
MSFQLRQAQKSKSKMRLGLSGPSGSGKTYSALLLAAGIAPWEKICLIDTENGSGELYSHLGKYNVIVIDPPYSPERYIEAIKAAEDAGMEVIIVDSASHEWDGEGGCLQINEQLANTKFKGNTWAAWSQTTPRHQKFIYAITGCKAHIITTARAKTDTIQTEDKKIKKVGLKEIQREGYEYELTVNFNLDRDGNFAIASKDRTGMFINADPFKITKKTGEDIKKWADDGLDPQKLVNKIDKLIVKKGQSKEKLLEAMKTDDLATLSVDMLNKIITRLESLPNPEDKKPEPPKTPETPESGEMPPQDPKSEEIDVDEIDAGIQAQKAEQAAPTPPSNFEAEMDANNAAVDAFGDDEPEAPAAPEVKMATGGDIKLFEAVLKRRAAQNKKGYQAMLNTFLGKIGKEKLEDLTHDQITQIIDKLTKLTNEHETAKPAPQPEPDKFEDSVKEALL